MSIGPARKGLVKLLVYDRQPNKLTGASQSHSSRPPPSDNNTKCDDVGQEENLWTQQIT